MFNVDRKIASRMLKVSIRTIDRYIRTKKLSTEKRDGRIWLSKEEIIKLKRQKSTPPIDIDDIMNDDYSSIDKSNDKYSDKTLDKGDNANNVVHVMSRDTPSQTNDNVYQKLFEEAQHDLKRKQELLEGANYRVGQLEATLKETVPLLEHQKLLGQQRLTQAELAKINKDLADEKMAKKIYFIILFIVMLLQPLWLFLKIF